MSKEVKIINFKPLKSTLSILGSKVSCINLKELNHALMKINRNIVIFKHELEFKIVLPNGKFQSLNKKITIKL